MADGDRQRVGRIVRRRDGGQTEKQLDHLLDLRLLRAPVSDNRPLDLGRRVLDDRKPGLRGREHRHAARVAELQRAAHVRRIEDVLDGDRIRAAFGQQLHQAAMNLEQFVGERSGDRGASTAPQVTMRWRDPSVSTQP